MDIKFSFEIFTASLAHPLADADEKVTYIEGLKDILKEKIQATLLKEEDLHDEFEMRDVEMKITGKVLDEEVCRRVGGVYKPPISPDWDVKTCVVTW